jgi:hypothetical protein
MKTNRRPVLVGALLTLLAVTTSTISCTSQAPKRPAYADKVGIELDGIGDGSRSMPFVDVAKTLRPWTLIGKGDLAPTDSNGWPTSDCQTVFFDIRPFGAWAPPIDDPDAFQPDWSGTYHLSFLGQATIGSSDATRIQINNQRYDAATKTTSAEIVLPKGMGLLVMTFTKTKRTPSSPEGSGITNVRLLRPGYPANTKQVFTNEFLKALKPFKVLRYMDWLDSNVQPGYYGDPGHHVLNWSDRRLPTDATQQRTGKKYGCAWEHCIQLANETGTDMWINIPIAATDDYVRQLARMLKAQVKPGINIYVEHCNEVWNFGFPQYTYNKLAAIGEVKQGNSPLNNDGSTDQEVWAHRRHGKRLHDIAMIFKEVFGAGALNTRIRPVYASWIIMPDSHYKNVLKWLNDTYGPPKNYFYSVAGAAYFNAQKAGPNASPQDILAAMRQSSDEHLKFRQQIQAIGDAYGLKHMQYEVGPDNGGGSPVNVANRIRANRLAGMKDLILHDAVDNWFSKGGDLYMYFAMPGAYSRYGCWGLSEDIRQLDTPKWQAIYALTGTRPPK